MNFKLHASLLFFSLLSFLSKAQIEGDSLFGFDQIVTIELQFNQTNYFDSLEANYTNGDYMKADLTITTSQTTASFTDVGVRLKGNSSYTHPNNKKSFKIDFNKYISGQKFDGLKKLNFNNGFKDPSFIREKIFFDVCKDLGVPAPRANFANVYFNGTLWGVYTMIEQIDDQFLDWAIGDDGGNLFKAGDNFGGANTPADLVYYGANATDYTDRYELKTNETANDWTDLISLMDFINNSSDADFEQGLYSHFEVEDLLRSVALDNLFSNLDSYTGSARNYYLYHNETTGLWEWIKWDGNESFGSYTSPGQNPLTMAIDYHDASRPLLERIFANETLMTLYKNILCSIMTSHFNSSHLDPKIDGYYSLIKSFVYADTKKMYTNANFDDIIENNISSGGPGPVGGTTYGIKPFISSRNTNVSGQVDCNFYTGLDELSENDFSVFPNPANKAVTVHYDLGLNENSTLSLVNLQGQKVSSHQIKPNTSIVSIPTSDLIEGIYFLQFITLNGTLVKKITIIH